MVVASIGKRWGDGRQPIEKYSIDICKDLNLNFISRDG
jgi:hypothetical protein